MKIREISGMILVSLLLGGVLNGAQPPTVLKLKIPDYIITKVGKLDYVDIPGGWILMAEEGRPRVPFYIKYVDYPRGYSVQEVVLKKKAEPVLTTGLKLPVITLNPNLTMPVKMKEGIYPEQDYEWKSLRNPDGSSVLVISLYPFYYDPKTTDAKFHKDYELEIKYVKTTFSLTSLGTDRNIYEPGEQVKIKAGFNNSGKPQDMILTGTVKNELTGEAVTEITGKEMKSVSKTDSASLEWQTKGFPAGDYCVEVSMKDSQGNILDRGVKSLRLGIPGCDITSFKVTPETFKIGRDIQLALDLKNTGSYEISGCAVFEIKVKDSLIDRFSHDFSSLAPGNVLHFTDTWNTGKAAKGLLYNVLGYVKFEGSATLPRRILISTNIMPVAEFTYSPEKTMVSAEISFDATRSRDADGKIVEYNWDFGDGGTGSGNKVTHTYYLTGDYDVTLTVKDNESGIGQTGQKVIVGE